jgi:hypothetical protein
LSERYVKTVKERLTKCSRVTPEGLGWGITHLPPGLQGIHSRHYGLDPSQPSVRARTPTALRPAIWGAPRQGTTQKRSCGRLSGSSIRYPNYACQHCNWTLKCRPTGSVIPVSISERITG